MKILQVGADLLHVKGRTDERADIQTDRYDEANGRFSQFREKRLRDCTNTKLS